MMTVLQQRATMPMPPKAPLPLPISATTGTPAARAPGWRA
jgi:hypothetical protein